MSNAFNFFITNGTTTCTNTAPGLCNTGCQPYTSGGGTNPVCPTGFKCKDGSAWPQTYRASSQRALPSALNNPVATVVQNMMIDIMTYGPLTVGFDVYQNFFSYNVATDVYNQSSGSYLGGHAVKIIGWGSTSGGMPYWLIANSWNVYWGSSGYFKFLRGSNLCGIENYATAVYTQGKPYKAARTIEENLEENVEEERRVGGDFEVLLPVNIPGGVVTHLDLESDFIINAANDAVNMMKELNPGMQASQPPVVQSAYTSVSAGVNYDMTMVVDGTVYHVLMFQNLQGVMSFTAPPTVVGSIAGGSAGLTGGDIAAIVVCSVFGAALVVAAGVYVATRNREDSGSLPGTVQEEGKPKEEGVAEEAEPGEGKRTGIPVMNPFSHIRRVKAGEHQSVTGRSNVQK